MKTRTNNSKRIISSVRASMAVEGLKPSVHAQAIGKKYLEGVIDSSEAIARIKAVHASNFKR